MNTDTSTDRSAAPAAASAVAASPAPGSVVGLAQRLRGQRAFVTAVLILAGAALAMNLGVVSILQVYFMKLPVPLRQSLAELPPAMGNWVQVSRDERLDHDMEQALAAKEYIFRDYVNPAVMGLRKEDLLRRFEGKNWQESKREIALIRQTYPAAVMTLGLTYYTGQVDTVAHIPEVCYVAGGFEPVNPGDEQWKIAGQEERLPDGLPLRFITFEEQAGAGQARVNVAYFFNSNGAYESSSLAVRRKLQNPLTKYGYYAKVELMNTVPNREASAKAMRDFLAAALPEVSKALPDWEQYKK